MANTLTLTRLSALSWLAFQCLILLLLTGLTAVLASTWHAKAVFLGGLVVIVPNVLFALGLFSVLNAKKPARMLAAWYGGECVKLSLTGLLFVWVIKTYDLPFGALVAGLITSLLAFWLAPFVIRTPRKKENPKIL